MNVTSAQYAALVAAFGSTQADAMIAFMGPQLDWLSSTLTGAFNATLAAIPQPQWVPVTRTAGTLFTPHATRFTLCFYMVELYVPLTILLTSGSAQARLIVNGIQQGSPLQAPAGALGLDQTLQLALMGLAPPGASVLIEFTTTGSGTADLVSTNEILL